MAVLVPSLIAVYAALGALFAIYFVTRGVSRLDPEAGGSSVGFRILILPGTVALWPLLLARSYKLREAVGEIREP